MAGRYLLSGTQLGLIKGYAEAGKIKELNEIIDEIIKNQFLGNTNNNIKKDVDRYLIENIGNNLNMNIKKR
jgi:hypothetical protein